MCVDGNMVMEEGCILGDRKQCIWDVCVGFDGYLYVLIDEFDGQLFKVSFVVMCQVIGIIIIL